MMRQQRSGAVNVELDGNAHLHVWEPNKDEGDGIDVDLTEHLALIISLGRDAPTAEQPDWRKRGGTVVIISLDVGSRGRISIDGHDVSEQAATALAADGFMELLRGAIADVAEPEGSSSGSTEPGCEQPHDGTDEPEGEPCA